MPDFPAGITDDDLLQAIRKRLLEEIMAERQSQNVIQNIIGRGLPSSPSSPSGQSGAGGVFQEMGYRPTPDDFEYGVDIERRDVYGPDPNWIPEPGSEEKAPLIKTGWEKFVKRYRTPRGQDIEQEKKK